MGNCKSRAHNQVVGPAYHDDNKGVFRYDKDSRQVVYMGEDAEATAITTMGSSEDAPEGDNVSSALSTSNSISISTEHQMPDDEIRAERSSLLGEISAFLEEDGDDNSTVYSIFSQEYQMKSPQGDEFNSPYYRHFNGSSTVDIQKTAESPLVLEHETLEKYKVTNSEYKVTNSAAYPIERRFSEDHTEISGRSGDSSTLNGLMHSASSESSEYHHSFLDGAISADTESQDDSDVYNTLEFETHKSQMVFKPIAPIKSTYDSNMMLLDDDKSQSSLDDIQSALQTFQHSGDEDFDEGCIAITKSRSMESATGYDYDDETSKINKNASNKVLASGYDSGDEMQKGPIEQGNSSESKPEEFSDECNVSSSSVSSSESTSIYGKTENIDDNGHFESLTEVTIQKQVEEKDGFIQLSKSSSSDSETTPRSCVEDRDKSQGSTVRSYSSQEDMETDDFVLAAIVDTVQPSLNDSSIVCAELHPSLLAPDHSPGNANVLPDRERFPAIEIARDESLSQERDGHVVFSAHVEKITMVETKMVFGDLGEKGARTPITIATKDIVTDEMDFEGQMHRVHPLIEVEDHDVARSQVEDVDDNKNGVHAVDANSISFDDLIEYDQLMTKAFEADAHASRPEDMDIYEASWLPGPLSAVEENPNPFDENDNSALLDSKETAYPDDENLSESSSVESGQSGVESEPALPNASEEESKLFEEDVNVLGTLPDGKDIAYPESENLSESSSVECDPFNKGSKSIINESLEKKEKIDSSANDISFGEVTTGTTFEFGVSSDNDNGLSFEDDDDTDLSIGSSMLKSAANQRRIPTPEAKLSSKAKGTSPVVSHVPHENDKTEVDNEIQPSAAKVPSLLDEYYENSEVSGMPGIKLSPETAPQVNKIDIQFCGRSKTAEFDNETQSLVDEISSLLDDNVGNSEDSGDKEPLHSPESIMGEPHKFGEEGALSDDRSLGSEDEIMDLARTEEEDIIIATPTKSETAVKSMSFLPAVASPTATPEGSPSRRTFIPRFPHNSPVRYSSLYRGTRTSLMQQPSPVRLYSRTPPLVPDSIHSTASTRKTPTNQHMKFDTGSQFSASSADTGSQFSASSAVSSSDQTITPLPWDERSGKNTYRKAHKIKKLLKTPEESTSTSDNFCSEKWDPYLHANKRGCERCLTLCSRPEAEDFFKFGRHTRVSRTGGGCTKNCNKYAGERFYGCESVRLCRICFNAVHRNSKVLVKDKTVRSLNVEYF